MERYDPNPRREHLSDEGGLAVRAENGAVFPPESDLQFDFDHRATSRERAITRLRLLWANRRFLVRVAGIAMLLSAGLALLIPKSYESVARLMPPENQSGSGLAMAAMALGGGGNGSSMLGGLGGLAGQLLGLKSTSDLLVGVLNSRTVADGLIQKFDLQKVYGTRRKVDAQKMLESRTEALVDRKNQIVTIIVADHDPRRAQAMAETYVEELNRVLAQVSTSSARREREFLEGRLQGVNRDLEKAERDLSQFSSKNAAIDIGTQGKAMVESAAILQGQLIAARSELEGLRQIYTDNNIRVRSTQARVAELESQLRKLGGADDNASTGESSGKDNFYPSIRQLPLLGVGYADLYRKAKVQEAAFETLTQEYELAKVQEAKEIPVAKVLDAPSFPEKKSFPPRTLMVLLSTSLALIGAVVWIFGKARWDELDPADPGKLLAQEVIHTMKAAIPWAARNGFHTGANADSKVPKP